MKKKLQPEGRILGLKAKMMLHYDSGIFVYFYTIQSTSSFRRNTQCDQLRDYYYQG